MDENILSIGIKIELVKPKSRIEDDSNKNVTYVSQIIDMEGDLITCAMPIYEGHLIPLETGTEFESYFYTKKGIFKGRCKVTSRGKEGNIYICQLLLMTELKKFQRRQFFRLPCTLDVQITPLREIEMLAYIKNHAMPETLTNPTENGIVVDLSGGGMRIISNEKYEKGVFIALDFILNVQGVPLKMQLLGQVIQSFKSETNELRYDQRVQFREISRDVQDEIIKYIFEEQRKLRRKEQR